MKEIYKTFSLPFQITNLLIDFLYKKKLKKPFRIDIPVLSIGNISFGGEGKTPFSISLAKFFLQKGITPAILLRGYKGKKESKGEIVSNGIVLKEDWEEVGEEAVLIANNIQNAIVIIGKNRIKSAIKAKEMGAKIIILDDGFQFRKLFRDLNIVIVSPKPLLRREFLISLSRADAILIYEGWAEDSFLRKIIKIKKELHIFKYKISNLGIFDKNGAKVDITGERVIAFCGIANPFRFVETLNSISIKPESIIFFPDHHKFNLKDLEKIEREAEKKGAKIAVTTEKDFIKLSKLPFSIKIVYSKIEVFPQEEFYGFVSKRLKI